MALATFLSLADFRRQSICPTRSRRTTSTSLVNCKGFQHFIVVGVVSPHLAERSGAVLTNHIGQVLAVAPLQQKESLGDFFSEFMVVVSFRLVIFQFLLCVKMLEYLINGIADVGLLCT